MIFVSLRITGNLRHCLPGGLGGWEVWLDGQEITQFTYFQQAGGMTLDVPAVEITYGLERIAMTLQRVNDFKRSAGMRAVLMAMSIR